MLPSSLVAISVIKFLIKDFQSIVFSCKFNEGLRSLIQKLQVYIAIKEPDKESHTHLEHKPLIIYLNKHKGGSCIFSFIEIVKLLKLTIIMLTALA